MALLEQFLSTVAAETGAPSKTGSNVGGPSGFSRAVVQVLPVDAAGISLSQRLLRVPLGWSSPDAAMAERIQTTLGAGPCLAAADAEAALVVDAAGLADRWPVYHDELVRLTPFRSAAAVPLKLDNERPFGALNLYASQPDLSTVLSLDEVEVGVARPIAGWLIGAFDRLYGDQVDIPDWLDADPAVGRMTVWSAVGMIIGAARVPEADALALLRAYAYSHQLTLDQVSEQLVDRQLPTAAVLAG